MTTDNRLEGTRGGDAADPTGPRDDRPATRKAALIAYYKPTAADWRELWHWTRRVVGWLITLAAAGYVVAAMVIPNELTRLSLDSFLRVPVEGLVLAAVLLAAPGRVRQVLAGVAGLFLGVLLLVKFLDMGFLFSLARPFDLVLDWSALRAGLQFLTESSGRAAGIGAVVGVVVLVLAVLILTPLAIMRLSRLMARHRTASAGSVAVVAVAWVTCTALGMQMLPEVPLYVLTRDRALQVQAGIKDQEAFQQDAAVDAFRNTPGNQLLTALRGKNVVLAFVESYGRDAIEDPEFATQVGAVLEGGTRSLDAAGFASRSGWLTSPTVGGYSWFAHSTLLSGLWIDNQQRYRNLVSGDRLTLTRAFKQANWRTVGLMPRVTGAWQPEQAFYDFDRVYDGRNLGYKGPAFSFATVPDQYTMQALQRLELDAPDGAPRMAEIELISSHAPWTPTPRLIGWDDIGDGSIYEPMAKEGDSPEVVWREPERVRTEYRRSIEYTLSTLISYVQTYGDDDLVLIFLGDHQPAPIVTGENPVRDVPISIVTKDRAVLDRMSGWGWDAGLKPGPQAPAWRMNTFRDRFLTTFSPPGP